MLSNNKRKVINCLLKEITSVQQRKQQQQQPKNHKYEKLSKSYTFNFTNFFEKICYKNVDENSNNSSSILKKCLKKLKTEDLKLLNEIIIENQAINCCLLYDNNYHIKHLLYLLLETIYDIKIEAEDEINDQLIQTLPCCRMYNNEINIDKNNINEKSNNNNKLCNNSHSINNNPHHYDHLNSFSSSLCLNPYHWTVLIERPEYQQYYNDCNIVLDEKFFNNPYGCCETISMLTNCDSTNYLQSLPQQQQKQSQQSMNKKKWARLSYWEYKEPRITNINVVESIIILSYNQSSNICDNDSNESIESISLSSLLSKTMKINENNYDKQQKIRSKIDNGIILYQDPNKNVWIYNRSRNCSIFIESPLYYHHSSASSIMNRKNIVKVLPGHSIIVYDYQLSKYRSSKKLSTTTTPPPLSLIHNDNNSFRFSFVKGFGNGYKLNDIMDCPCWMEVILF